MSSGVNLGLNKWGEGGGVKMITLEILSEFHNKMCSNICDNKTPLLMSRVL